MGATVISNYEPYSTTWLSTRLHAAAHQSRQRVVDAHSPGEPRESQTLVDDGSGKVEIWRIEDFDMVSLDRGMYGQFFGGDSYVILYTYMVNRKENYIIYFWQGQVHI